MTDNFYDKKKSMINAALCLDKVPYLHDARTCLDLANAVIWEYDINLAKDPKIGFITADNGSNMKKAYS